MAFDRLAINDLSDEGMQPFRSDDGLRALVCNGEIYNHEDLEEKPSKSDCACLLPLVERVGIMSAASLLDGEFAMCYTDGSRVLAARDHLGVRPLFYTRFEGGAFRRDSDFVYEG